jgi:hypothetical protein
MEILSKINTDYGLEMTIKLNGSILKKVFSHEHLNAFLEQEKQKEINLMYSIGYEQENQKRRKLG